MSRNAIQTHLFNAELKNSPGEEMSDIKLSEKVSSIIWELFSNNEKK